jgi:UDP-N-acetylmuramoyl-L-alanyl-D-glutamate--2,6-diaminopimelate ligase
MRWSPRVSRLAGRDPPRKVFAALAHLKGAPGRLEKVAYAASGAPIYVDYAHTPDALETVLKALRPHVAGRLHSSFRLRRRSRQGQAPLDGRRSRRRLADIAIVTDDNPRSEDAASFAGRFSRAARARGNRRPRDRHREAIRSLREGDCLVIAGKGHETGQIVGGRREPSPTAKKRSRPRWQLGTRRGAPPT